jgi:signal peptidase I
MQRFLEPIREFVAEWTVTILILLFGTTSIMQAFVVPTSSMVPTIMVGDHLIVDKLAYAPAGAISQHLLPYHEVRRGDIIVFRFPPDPRQNYVKRVVGQPGDRLKIIDKAVYINGQPLPEPYKRHIDNYNLDYRDKFPSVPIGVPPDYVTRVQEMLQNVQGEELVVPPGFFFAMGDNRDNSLDSRYWGFVPRDNIVGKPTINFWSYNSNHRPGFTEADEFRNQYPLDYSVEHMSDLVTGFFTKTRWIRTLKLIRGYHGE